MKRGFRADDVRQGGVGDCWCVDGCLDVCVSLSRWDGLVKSKLLHCGEQTSRQRDPVTTTKPEPNTHTFSLSLLHNTHPRQRGPSLFFIHSLSFSLSLPLSLLSLSHTPTKHIPPKKGFSPRWPWWPSGPTSSAASSSRSGNRWRGACMVCGCSSTGAGRHVYNRECISMCICIGKCTSVMYV